MKKILVFDPGESTGWVCQIADGTVLGGTAPKHHPAVEELLYKYEPDIVVMERFNLYPGMAKHLAWNSFYPCEVIGVIRNHCLKNSIQLVEQAPSVKKFAGSITEMWEKLRRTATTPVTEHTKDALMHLAYYLRNNK